MRVAGWDGDRWRRTTTALVTAALALALAAGIAAAPPQPAAHRAAPPRLRAALTLPTLLRVPGDPARLPWPATGQAALAVAGVGDLGSSGPPRPVPIASVAKAMTAYLVLTRHPLAPGGQGPPILVTAADAAEYVACRRRGEAAVRVVAGETLTERQALEAMLLPSANNIARMLARWDSGSVPGFVARMNATADRLGMTGTSYTDPSGLDPSTTSTAADQVRLGMAAMRVPVLAAIAAMPMAVVPVAGLVRNYNTLLGQDGITGLKTGSTQAAGGCVLIAAWHKASGHRTLIVAAAFGQPGTAETILPNALQAGHNLVLALDRALGHSRR